MTRSKLRIGVLFVEWNKLLPTDTMLQTVLLKIFTLSCVALVYMLIIFIKTGIVAVCTYFDMCITILLSALLCEINYR